MNKKELFGKISLSICLSLLLFTGLSGCTGEETNSSVPEKSGSSKMYKPAKIAKHVIISEMNITLAIQKDGTWGYAGSLPGEVEIPECEDIQFSLGSLDETNLDDYQAEIFRLEMKNISLPEAVDQNLFEECINRGMLDGIRDLSLINCNEIFDLSPLAKVQNLRELTMPVESNDYLSLSMIPGLQIVAVWDCVKLNKLTKIRDLKGLHLLQSENLTNLKPLKKMAGLEELWLHGCEKLTDFSSLSHLENLKYLSIHNCSHLTDLSDLPIPTGLEELSFVSCDLTDISALSEVSTLKKIEFINCSSLTKEKVEELKKALPNCEVLFYDVG